jgi:hypothetical protein
VVYVTATDPGSVSGASAKLPVEFEGNLLLEGSRNKRSAGFIG